LYASHASGNGAVVEINPSTGVIVRTVANIGGFPTGLAQDPVSGDLFVSVPEFFCFSQGIFRISNFANGPGTVTPYANVNCTSPDGIVFGPDGTLFVAGNSNGTVNTVSSTNSANPGTFTQLASVAGGPDGIALQTNPADVAHP